MSRLKLSYFVDLLSVLAFVFTIAFRDFDVLCIIFQMLFAVVSFVNLLYSKRKISWYYVIWIAIFTAYCFLSLTWADFTDTTLEYSISVLQNLILSVAVYINLKTEKHLNKYLKLFLVSVIISILRTVIFNFHDTFSSLRVQLVGVHVNEGANLLTFSAVIAFLLLLSSKSLYEKIALISIFLIDCLLVFLSASKKNLLVLPIVILFILIFNSKSVGQFLKYLIIMIVAVMLIFVIAKNNFDIFKYSYERITTFLQGNPNDSSTATRLDLMKYSIKTFKENPLFGCGLANNMYHNPYHVYAHSNYFELLPSIGIIGFILYYSFHIKTVLNVIKYAKRRPRNLSVMIISLILSILALDIAQVTYYNEVIYILFAFIAFASGIKIDDTGNEEIA